MVNKYDIITLGSASVDVFVKANSEIRKHEHHTDIAYHLGEKVLIDDLHFATGGGATNNAVGFSRLGLKTGCIAVVGKDNNGYLVISTLKKEGVDFLGTMKEGKTGYSVILAGKKDRTILAYKGINNKLKKSDIQINDIKTKWLYASTMMGESFRTSEYLIKKLKAKGTKVGMNISLYLAKQGIHKIKGIIKHTDLIILNLQEAEVLTGKKNVEEMFHEFSKYTKARVVITNGQYTIYAADTKSTYIKRIHPVKAVETTGAGDAFATGVIYGMMTGKSMEKCLDYGHKEAVSVLKSIGAKSGLLRKLD